MARIDGMQPARASAGRRRRILRAGLLIGVGLLLAGCKTDLYTKLSEQEANEMVALLLDRGIDAARVGVKDGTSTVQVEQARFARAVEILKARGYPHQTFATLGDVFKGGGLVASPTEERARYIYALSQELSKTVSSIDGVLSARIHVVLPKNDLLRSDSTPSSASVFIRHDHDAPVKALLPQIKLLVANSIEGLSYDRISVVFVPVERPSTEHEGMPETGSAHGAPPGATGQLSVVRERSWLDSAIAALIGAGVALLLSGAAVWLFRLRRHRQEPEPGRLAAQAAADALPAPADLSGATPTPLRRAA